MGFHGAEDLNYIEDAAGKTRDEYVQEARLLCTVPDVYILDGLGDCRYFDITDAYGRNPTRMQRCAWAIQMNQAINKDTHKWLYEVNLISLLD